MLSITVEAKITDIQEHTTIYLRHPLSCSSSRRVIREKKEENDVEVPSHCVPCCSPCLNRVEGRKLYLVFIVEGQAGPEKPNKGASCSLLYTMDLD